MLHPTRLSQSMSGSDPAVLPQEIASLWNGTHHRRVCVCELSRNARPAMVLRGCAGCARLLTRGQTLCPVALSQTEAGIADRSLKPSEAVPKHTSAAPFRVCSNVCRTL
jgi:hypothetical protein